MGINPVNRFFWGVIVLALCLNFSILSHDFYYHDDFRFWEGQVGNESLEGIAVYYLALGRPFLSWWMRLAEKIFFLRWQLWPVRLLVIGMVIISAIFFKKLWRHPKYAVIPEPIRMATALGIIILPSFYSASIWIICSAVPLATLLALAGNFFFDARPLKQPRHINEFLCVVMVCMSYVTYQTAASVFLVPYIILALYRLRAECSFRSLGFLIKPTVLFVGASILYLVIHKLIVFLTFLMPRGAEQFAFSTDPVAKIQSLLGTMTPMAMNFIPGYGREFLMLAVLLMLLVAWGSYVQQRQNNTVAFMPRYIVMGSVLVFIYMAFLNCVNLAAVEGTIMHRTVSSMQLLFFGLFMMGLYYLPLSKKVNCYLMLFFILLITWGGTRVVVRTVLSWHRQLEAMQQVFDGYLERTGAFPKNMHVYMIQKDPPRGNEVMPFTLYAWYEEPRAWGNRVMSRYMKHNSRHWVYDGTEKYKDYSRPARALVKITYSFSSRPFNKGQDTLIVDLPGMCHKNF